MTTKQLFSYNPDLSLPVVHESTIAQFEKSAPECLQMYQNLFANNYELALWLRQRAELLFPDLSDREEAVTMTLEAITILANQLTIDGLTALLP